MEDTGPVPGSSMDDKPGRSLPPSMVVVPAGGMKDVNGNSRWIFSSTGQAQFVHHKTFPIKRLDGEPLMREELQYDFLLALFTNEERCFTDNSTAAQTKPRHPSGKATFGELYINSILSSSKCTKIQRDKMNDTPAFARDFAMMCLLVNVGRVNTTLAFYPEMRTVLRTYHPVPALQKSDGNLQDAPRMKSVLKGCLFPDEVSNAPTTPPDIRALVRSGRVPSTNVVNLIFALTNHSASMSRQHFPASPVPLDFHDLFLPINVSCKDRAQAFLWLMFDYLEGLERPNPFASEEWASQHPDMVPPLPFITQAEMERENADPPDEQELAKRLITNRRSFLQDHTVQDELQTRTDSAAAKKKRAAAPLAGSLVDKESAPSPSKKLKKEHAVKEKLTVVEDVRGSSSVPKHYPERVPAAVTVPRRPEDERPRPYTTVAQPDHKRTPFAQAFKIVTIHDAMYDSDEEIERDENARLDYQRRLEVLRTIRGRDVTPPREVAPGVYISDNDEAEDKWHANNAPHRVSRAWEGEAAWHGDAEPVYAHGY